MSADRLRLRILGEGVDLVGAARVGSLWRTVARRLRPAVLVRIARPDGGCDYSTSGFYIVETVAPDGGRARLHVHAEGVR